MSDKNKTDPHDLPEPEAFANLSDEQLIELIRNEGSKDASVLAKLVIIQRIRKGMLSERKWLRVATGAAIVLSILALVVGIGGYLALQNYLDERDERTHTACNTQRNTAINDNRSLEAQVDGLYFIESLSVDPASQPVEAAFLMTQVDLQVANIRSNYQKVRSCTDEAISEYNRTEGRRGYEDGPTVEMAQRRTPIDIPPEIREQIEAEARRTSVSTESTTSGESAIFQG